MANIFSVSNSEELMNALASASGGDTIELAGGDYGELKLVHNWTDFNVKFDSPVTIRSVDADEPASFSKLDLHGVSNLTFEGLVFDYTFDLADPIYTKPFKIDGDSSNITIKDSVFDGDVAEGLSVIDDGYGYGMGLSVRNSSNISIENNEFFDWHRAAIFSQSEGLSVIGNEVYDIRSDGFNFAEVSSVLIQNNYLHDFKASAESQDHLDMIQFWTNGTDSPTTNVVISNNILDIGEGSWTQSIFMRNEEVDLGRAGVEMYYQNILIENNTIYNAHTHGITVGETDGLIIQNNSILQVEGDMHGISGPVTIPKINVKPTSFSVQIEGNVVSAINGYDQQSDWTVSGNAILQPSDYLENFVTSTIDADNGAHKFIALPDSLIEQLSAGVDHIRFPTAPSSLTPLFQVHSEEASEHTLIFDASLTVGPLGLVSENDAEFLWTFEDGSTATGQIVKHDFAVPGYHDVTLSVVSGDGTTAQAQFTTAISGSDILQFDTQSGHFEVLQYGEEATVDNGSMPLLTNLEGYALKLGGEGLQASVAASELSRFFGTDAFELSMSLKADNSESWGEIARVHTSFTTSINENGEFTLTLFLNDGSLLHMASKGITLNDGASHNVTIRFDGQEGFAEILIDGQVAASESVFGSLGGSARDLYFGNPWGKQNFDGELSEFSLSADSKDFPVYEGSAEVISDAEQPTPDAEQPAPDAEQPAPDAEQPAPDAEQPAPDAEEPIESEPVLEEDSGALDPLLLGGYELDIANVSNDGTVKLHDDAHVVGTPTGSALSFDGKKDYASLGRLTEFETSQKIAFSVDFTSDAIKGGTEKLVWNHMKVGLSLEGDGIRVLAANNDDAFHKGFKIDGLSLDDGVQHTATVMVDAESDRLQVVIDDVLVLDERETDFDFVGAGGYEWGWSLGTAWNNWFSGQVHEFQVSDDFTFIEQTPEDGTILA